MLTIADNKAVKSAHIEVKIKATKQAQYVLYLTGFQTKNSTTILRIRIINTSFNVTQVEIAIHLKVTTET